MDPSFPWSHPWILLQLRWWCLYKWIASCQALCLFEGFALELWMNDSQQSWLSRKTRNLTLPEVTVNRWSVCSAQFSHSVMSSSLQPHGPQHARPSCPSPTSVVYSDSCPLSWWCHPTNSSPSPPAFILSQHQGLFQWVRFLHQVAKVFEFQLQHQPLQWIFRTDFL